MDFQIIVDEEVTFANLIKNEWGLTEDTYRHLMMCGINMECLSLIRAEDIQEVFFDISMIGQKIIFRDRLEKWRKNNSLEHSLKSQRSPTPPMIEPEIITEEVLNHPSSSCSSSPIPTPEKFLIKNSLFSKFKTKKQIPHFKGAKKIDKADKIPDPRVFISENAGIDLESLLKETARGSLVIQTYEHLKKLDKTAQTCLTHVIVESYLYNGMDMNNRDMFNYAQAIHDLFPNEQVSTYFVPRDKDNKNAKGKLYDRYFHERAKLRKMGFLETNRKPYIRTVPTKKQQQIDIVKEEMPDDSDYY